MCEAGVKTNILPPRASLTVDCRIVPGISPEEFVQEFRDRYGGVYVTTWPLTMYMVCCTVQSIERVRCVGVVSRCVCCAYVLSLSRSLYLTLTGSSVHIFLSFALRTLHHVCTQTGTR